MKILLPKRMPRRLAGLKKTALPSRLCGYCGKKFVLTRSDRKTCCHQHTVLLWQRENPDARAANTRKSNLKKKYGITPEGYAEQLKKQGGGCAGCGVPVDGKKQLAVDHNHETGKVRGLLCFHCNTILGKAGEDPQRLRALAGYLERGGVR